MWTFLEAEKFVLQYNQKNNFTILINSSVAYCGTVCIFCMHNTGIHCPFERWTWMQGMDSVTEETPEKH